MKTYMRRYLAMLVACVLFMGSVYGEEYTASAAAVYSARSVNCVATATDPSVPKNLGHLTVVPVSASSVKLTWDKCDQADVYRVYVYDSAKKKYIRSGSTKSTNYTVSRLAASGSSYTFAVKGLAVSGGKYVEATKLTSVTAKTLPGKVKVADLGVYMTNAVYLTWSAVKGADRYQVYRYSTIYKRWAKIAETDKLVYKNGGLAIATGYSYMVRAVMKYGGQMYAGDFSPVLRTATVPRSVSDAVYYERKEWKRSSSGDYRSVWYDEDFEGIRGYRIEFKKSKGADGYAVYYQDVKNGFQPDVRRARLLTYSKSTAISLRRTMRKGCHRVFWVSEYVSYGGRMFVNPSKIPVTYEGDIDIYLNSRGKTVEMQKKIYGAADNQLSEIRYYTAGGALKKYRVYIYNSRDFVSRVNTYNRRGRLIKVEKWR